MFIQSISGTNDDIYSWVYHIIPIDGNDYWTTQASFAFGPIPQLHQKTEQHPTSDCDK